MGSKTFDVNAWLAGITGLITGFAAIMLIILGEYQLNFLLVGSVCMAALVLFHLAAWLGSRFWYIPLVLFLMLVTAILFTIYVLRHSIIM